MLIIDLTSLVANSDSPIYDGAFITGDRPPVLPIWKINPLYRVGQKLPLKVIYPRPDNETTAYAVHRKASSHWQYEMRVCIQGGEAPFRHEIMSGPSGATIVEEFDRTVDGATGMIVHTLPENYATVRWETPTGTANWIVRVTDQSDAYVDVIWSTTVDETAFLIVDATDGLDANPGTWTEPKQTFATGVWENSSSEATYATKNSSI